jgi:hypothetical protein
MALAEIWAHECKRLGMKSVVHISHMCLRTARALAAHAAKVGADSIGMYPPFAPESPPDLATVVSSIEFATRGIELPLYYYHIPAVTGVQLNVSDLVDYSRQHSLLPRLSGARHIFISTISLSCIESRCFFFICSAGVKFVSDDLRDFARVQAFQQFDALWAPEPKIQVTASRPLSTPALTPALRPGGSLGAKRLRAG